MSGYDAHGREARIKDLFQQFADRSLVALGQQEGRGRNGLCRLMSEERRKLKAHQRRACAVGRYEREHGRREADIERSVKWKAGQELDSSE